MAPRDAQELAERLTAATADGFRNRLLAQGQAQSVIRRAGILPPGAPQFSTFLDADLLNYGYALLSTSLLLVEAAGDDLPQQLPVAQHGFIQSSYAIEAATRNAAPGPDLVFHHLVAGAASHLGGYAARAYSLIQGSRTSGRLTPMEQSLADVLMRDLGAVERQTRLLRSSPEATEQAMIAAFAGAGADLGPDIGPDQVGPVTLLLSENYMSAVTTALFAIEIGNRDMLDAAVQQLLLGEQASSDVSARTVVGPPADPASAERPVRHQPGNQHPAGPTARRGRQRRAVALPAEFAAHGDQQPGDGLFQDASSVEFHTRHPVVNRSASPNRPGRPNRSPGRCQRRSGQPSGATAKGQVA